ncbi:MAG: ABC transporter substrate-binding protein, partial [Clostridiales bacterium]
MKRNLKSCLSLLLLVALVITLTACGGNDSANTDDASSSATTTTNADPTTLRVAVSGDTETIDPVAGNMPRSTEAIANLYDQLFTYEIIKDENGLQVGDSTVVIGSLAKSWALDEAGTTYTITLRDDVKFHSGNPMTTADVAYSFDRALHSGMGTGAFDMSVVTVTDVVEIVDEYTFKMHTAETNPYALNVLQMGGCSIVDSKVFKENATDDDPWALKWAAKNEAGSGPYKLKSWDAGTQLIFEANEEYWNYDVYFKQMIWNIIPESSTQVMMMANGELDVIEGITANYLSKLENPNVNIMSFNSKNQLTLFMNDVDAGDKPLSDKYVRQAIAYCIPYQDIVDSVYYGAATVCDSVISVGSPNYDNSAWKYEYNVEKAKECLEKSAYAQGVSFTLSISNAFPSHETIAILMQDALSQIGVEMEINKLDNSAFSAKRPTMEAFLTESLAWVDDPSYMLDLSLTNLEGSDNARCVH